MKIGVTIILATFLLRFNCYSNRRNIYYEIQYYNHPDRQDPYGNCCRRQWDLIKKCLECQLLFQLVAIENGNTRVLDIGTIGNADRTISLSTPRRFTVVYSSERSANAYTRVVSNEIRELVDEGPGISLDFDQFYDLRDTTMYHHKVTSSMTITVEQENIFQEYRVLSVSIGRFIVINEPPSMSVCCFGRGCRIGCISFIRIGVDNNYYSAERARIYTNLNDILNINTQTGNTLAIETTHNKLIVFAYSDNENPSSILGTYDNFRINDDNMRPDTSKLFREITTQNNYIRMENIKIQYKCVGFNSIQCRQTFIPNERAYYDEEENRIRCKCGNYLPPECVQKSDDDKPYCKNGGDCIAELGSIRCECKGITHGTFCELVSEPNDCQFGILNPDLTCSCREGWTGEYCEIETCANINFCNRGICRIVNGSKSCVCNRDFSYGSRCEHECSPDCLNGICVEGINGPICKCDSGWYGNICDLTVATLRQDFRWYELRKLIVWLLTFIAIIIAIFIVIILLISWCGKAKIKRQKKLIVKNTTEVFNTRMMQSTQDPYLNLSYTR